VYIWIHIYVYIYAYGGLIHNHMTCRLLGDFGEVCVHTYIYVFIYGYRYIYIYTYGGLIHNHMTRRLLGDLREEYVHTYICVSARPYESCKIFKGRPRRNAFSKLVHCQYKSFPPDRFCQVEIQNTTGLSNKPSTA